MNRSIPSFHIWEPPDLRPRPQPDRADLQEFYDNLYAVLDDMQLPYTVDNSKTAKELKYNRFPVTPAPGVIYLCPHSHLRMNNLWNIKKAHLPGMVWFDRCGYAGWAELADSPEMFTDSQRQDPAAAEDFYKGLVADYIGGRRTKWTQSDQPYNGPGNYVFFPMQIAEDLVASLGRVPVLSLAERIAQWGADTGIAIVIKPHPLCKSAESRDLLNRLESLSSVHITHAFIHDVIAAARAVVTVNSGVGFEALLLNKPVYIAGKCDYQWVCHQLVSLDDIEDIDPDTPPPVDDLALKKFLYWYCTKYLIKTSSQDAIRARIELALTEFVQE